MRPVEGGAVFSRLQSAIEALAFRRGSAVHLVQLILRFLESRSRPYLVVSSMRKNGSTHSRSVSREQAESVGLVVKSTEEPGINDLLQSLFNQYEMAFDKSNFVKFYENAYGVNWGTSLQIVQSGQTPPSSK